VAGNDKLLKKVEQERSKGQLDRALARLKEGIAENPRDFHLAEEAATLCFQLGRTLEGAGILRTAIKRCPSERGHALEMLEREFATASSLELGEILYEAHLAQLDYDHAREVVGALSEPDRAKLRSKLRTKITSVEEESPNDKVKLAALLLAEAIVLSALLRSVDVATTFERILDLDPSHVAIAGRLAKFEMKQSPLCAEVRYLLVRCYLAVEKPDLAADQAIAAAKQPEFRQRAFDRLAAAPDVPPVRRARAELLLLLQRFAEGHDLLAPLLAAEPEMASVVRQTIEAVPHAAEATPELRMLHARTLAHSGGARQAIKEVQEARESGADAGVALATVEALLQKDSHNLDLVVMRAKLALDAGKPEVAQAAIKQVLDADPSRADKLCGELEAAAEKHGDAAVGRLLVDLYLQLEKPAEAAAALVRVRTARGAAPDVLYTLASDIAARYGLSAALLLVFVESALDTDRERDARAAVAHYLASPGVRTAEFAQKLGALARERNELAAALTRTFEGLALPVDLRLTLVTSAVQAGGGAPALAALQTLLLEHPEQRDSALAALESFIREGGDVPDALLAAAELHDAASRPDAALRCLARIIRVAPAETDRACKAAERILRRFPERDDCWRELVLALVEVQRYRHARELCYLAAQVLATEKQGFVHVALGEMMLAQGQTQNAVNEMESALACEDTPLEHLVGLLQKAVDGDARHGYARYVLAAALLRQGSDLDRAMEHLTAAVQQDDLLVDLAFELLTDYATVLEAHAPARVLEGLLFLRKGDRTQGVALLDRALELQVDLASLVVTPLETEWDRDPQNIAVGAAFVRALRGAGQARRACRLAVDLARRFPDARPRVEMELEALLEAEPLAEAHRALWEMLVDAGEDDAALSHFAAAVEMVAVDGAASRDLLEAGLRRQPGVAWIACRLAELEAAGGNVRRAEELLRGLLVNDPSQADAVLASLHSPAFAARTPPSWLLEADCALAAGRDTDALELLRRLRASDDADRSALADRYRIVVARGVVGVEAELEMGTLQQELGKIEDAVATLEAGLERAAASAPASTGGDTAAAARTERELRLALAQLYVELGREQEGRALLAKVLDHPGDHQETYGVLERLARKGMLGKLRSLRDTIASYPANLRARLELARLSIVSMDYDGAREALSFAGDSPAIEAARRYLLARSHADEDHLDLALAVLRSIQIDDVADDELRRNIVYLQGVCCEDVGQFGEAHALFLRILSEFPYFKDTRERVRRTYQKHLEAAVETRAQLLEKRTQVEVPEHAIGRAART
jgi:tetratricopeptide (TPR) repeat protein